MTSIFLELEYSGGVLRFNPLSHSTCLLSEVYNPFILKVILCRCEHIFVIFLTVLCLCYIFLFPFTSCHLCNWIILLRLDSVLFLFHVFFLLVSFIWSCIFVMVVIPFSFYCRTTFGLCFISGPVVEKLL